MTPTADLKERALHSFWVFCQEVLDLKLADQPHLEMCEYLEDQLQPNKMMLVPRDCLKTTIGSTAYPLWLVLKAYFKDGNPCYRVLIDSATARLSKFVIANIRQWVKHNATLKAVFGELYDRKGDSMEGLSLSFRTQAVSAIKEPNFVASGVGAEKTGLHFDMIVMDDIVTKDNVRTVAMREKTWEHYRMMQAILESDDTGQKTRLLVVGTRYSDDDLYGRMLIQDKERVAEGKPPVYAPMIRAAVDENGELFYPTKLTRDVLAHRRSVMVGLFWAQYMNDPNKDSAPLKPEDLKWHSIAEFPKELKWIRLSADPAYKEEEKIHGDYSAIVVAGWDRWNAMWILDVAMRRDLTPGAFIDLVFFMAKKWQIEGALIENPHQEAMDILFRREMQERGFSFPIFWVKPSRTRGKEMRWLDIQAYAERKAIKIATEIPSEVRVEIEDEWQRAPFSRFDDFLDALQLQAMYLPIDLKADRASAAAMRDIDGLIEAGKIQTNGPFFGRLKDVFPFIDRPAKPQKAIWESDSIAEQLDEAFN